MVMLELEQESPNQPVPEIIKILCIIGLVIHNLAYNSGYN